jgi:hypothetical protein
MVDLARYGMAAKAGALRKLSTLLATEVYLEAKTFRERARPGARRFRGVPRWPAQEQDCPGPEEQGNGHAQ